MSNLVGVSRFELELLTPEASVLPLYYTPGRNFHVEILLEIGN